MDKELQITIALVDDHAGLRVSLHNFLEHYGFSVVLQAANGLELIESLQVLDVLPDICILDVSMPVMDGFQTAAELAERYPQIKVLVFSTLDNKKSIVEMLKLGVKGYVLKGSSTENLRKAVKKLYEDSYYFSETISSTAYNYLAENRNFR